MIIFCKGPSNSHGIVSAKSLFFLGETTDGTNPSPIHEIMQVAQVT